MAGVIPIIAPLPDVAAHVEQAISIRGECSHWRRVRVTIVVSIDYAVGIFFLLAQGLVREIARTFCWWPSFAPRVAAPYFSIFIGGHAVRLIRQTNGQAPFRVGWQAVIEALFQRTLLMLLLCQPCAKSLGVIPGNIHCRMCRPLRKIRQSPVAVRF